MGNTATHDDHNFEYFHQAVSGMPGKYSFMGKNPVKRPASHDTYLLTP